MVAEAHYCCIVDATAINMTLLSFSAQEFFLTQMSLVSFRICGFFFSLCVAHSYLGVSDKPGVSLLGLCTQWSTFKFGTFWTFCWASCKWMRTVEESHIIAPRIDLEQSCDYLLSYTPSGCARAFCHCCRKFWKTSKKVLLDRIEAFQGVFQISTCLGGGGQWRVTPNMSTKTWY